MSVFILLHYKPCACCLLLLLSVMYVNPQRLKHKRSLSKMTIKCKRLEKAQNNPIAASFFASPVNEMEGYEQMWVAAIEDNFMQNLVAQFRSFGVQFADNFDTWEDQSPADAYRSIEDFCWDLSTSSYGTESIRFPGCSWKSCT
jgi:hypothetical protein